MDNCMYLFKLTPKHGKLKLTVQKMHACILNLWELAENGNGGHQMIQELGSCHLLIIVCFSGIHEVKRSDDPQSSIFTRGVT